MGNLGYAAKCAYFYYTKKAFVDHALFSHDLQDLESNGVVINGQCMYKMQLISFLGNNLRGRQRFLTPADGINNIRLSELEGLIAYVCLVTV